MKKMSLSIVLPPDLKLTDTDKGKTPSELAKVVVETVILSYGNHMRGLKEDERKQYYKISTKLEEAKEEVEFEDAEFGFVKKCFRDTPLMPNKLLREVENKVWEVDKRGD